MSRLTKEEKEDFKKLTKENKGKFFSTDGICTLGRYWKNCLLITVIEIVIIISIITLLYYIDHGRNIVQFHLHPVFYRFIDQQIEALKTEYFILIAIVFWLCIFELMVMLYITFLKVKRLRSVDINPWFGLIPIFSTIIAAFIPCKKDFQKNKFFNTKLKYKWLFVLILAILSLIYITYCLLVIYIDFFGN